MVIAGVAAVVIFSGADNLSERQSTGGHLNSNSDNVAVKVYENVEDRLPWLKRFYSRVESAVDAKSIFPVIVEIKKLLSNDSYRTVDEIFMELPLNKMTGTAMVAFVSSVFPARYKISSWDYTIERIEMALESKGLDSTHVLQGFV